MKQGRELQALVRAAAVQRRDAAEQLARVVADHEQHLIDAEMATTRRALLRLARRSGPSSSGYLDRDFLAAADRPTVWQAIIEAALALPGVSAVDLQACEPRDGTLRIVASQGFTPHFLDHFATLKSDQLTACVLAWNTGRPVLVDRVHDSDVFAETTAVEVMMAAGSRAVYSYPLISHGRVLGVLSLHGRRPLAQDHARAVTQDAAIAWATVTHPRRTDGEVDAARPHRVPRDPRQPGARPCHSLSGDQGRFKHPPS